MRLRRLASDPEPQIAKAAQNGLRILALQQGSAPHGT